MESCQFIKTLDLLFETKQRLSKADIRKEIRRIKFNGDNDLQKYIIKAHYCIIKPFMDSNRIHKGPSCANYSALKTHKIYDDTIIQIGHRVADALQLTEDDMSITLDVLNANFSTAGEINRLHLFIVLCVLTYLNTPLYEFKLEFVRAISKICTEYKSFMESVIRHYMKTDDLEFLDMANALLINPKKVQMDDLMHKIHSSYRINRRPYTPVPNLFELCSYDRTPRDGYNIKCINKSYQLASLQTCTTQDTEYINIDRCYSYIGASGKVGNNVYTQLLIDFHKHIYEKEIDMYKLHKLIMFDEEFTPYERRFAIMFHRAIIKHYIHKGGIGRRNEPHTIMFKDIIPNIKERGIIPYKCPPDFTN